MKQTKVIASGGMTAALSIVIMLIGGVLGLGMYISPMIAGFILLPIGRKYGTKYQWMLWACVSLLCFLFVPNIEENLMYFSLFGLYPILYPYFEKVPQKLKWVSKLLYFNVVVVAVEALVMLVLVPEAMGPIMAVILLVLGNVVFVLYDFLIPRSEFVFKKYFGKLKR